MAALVPQCELDGLIDINSQEVQSRLMTQALRKILYSLSRSRTVVICVNQVDSILLTFCWNSLISGKPFERIVNLVAAVIVDSVKHLHLL